MSQEDISENIIMKNDISENKITDISQNKEPEIQCQYIYKVLDHCGCSVSCKLVNKKFANISYSQMCDFCYLSLTPEKYISILNYFADDMRFTLKDLLHYKGWVDVNSWYSSMKILKHSKHRMNKNAKNYFNNFILPKSCPNQL